MSANNIVVIKEYRDNPRYRIVDKCVETSWEGFQIGATDDLKEAIGIANKYMQEEIVEYGMHIELIKK